MTLRSIPVLALAASVLVAGCGGAGDADSMDDFVTVSQGLSKRDTGRVIVKFKDGTTASQKAAAHRARGGRKTRDLRGGAELVSVTPAQTEAQASAYRARADVAWAEVDALVPHTHTGTLNPNDPLASYQWQSNAIQAPGAWSLSTGSTNVLIAICDTGVSATHPDLAAALRMDLCFNTADNAAGNCGPVADHGTAVAGSAAAIGNNGVGVAGVTWAAKIAPIRVSNLIGGSAYISDMAECLRYAGDVGAHVVNLSYQTYSNGTIFQSLLDAATYAEGKGTLVVSAAGNEGANAVTSQDPANILFVAATTNTNNATASFSNFGTYVDLAAPGDSVATTSTTVTCQDANADGVADPGTCVVSGDGYAYVSGTSFSSPIVAGAAALLKAINPAATPADLRAALTSTAVDLGAAGEDANYGAGLLNLHAAAHAIAGVTPPPPPPANTAPTITLVSPSTGAASVVAGTSVTFSATANDAEQGALTTSIVWTKPDGTTATGGSLTVTPAAAGTFTYTAKVTDAGGLSASATVTLTVTAPAVSLSAPTNLTVTGLSNRRAALAWQDRSTGEAGYQVQRASVKNGVIGSWSLRATLGANATAYTDSAAKGSFAYRVLVYSGSQSIASNVVQIKFP